MYISDLWYYRANSMYQHVSRKSISSQSLQILTYAVFFWNYDACNVLLPRYPMKIIYLQHHMRTIYSPEDAQCCILLIGGTSDEYLLRGGGGHWLVKFGPLKKVNGWSKKGPIFKISKLAGSFEAFSHLRAIKRGDSWAWCTPFGAQTWFFTEMQGNCKNWRQSKNPNSTHAKFDSMVRNIIDVAQEKEFLKNILSTTHNCEKGAPLKKPRFPWFL